MVKKEGTGIRRLEYSRWHRTISPKCYLTDLDAVEYRYGRGIVALMEIKSQHSELSDFQIDVFNDLEKNTPYPLYIVWYESPMDRFRVLNYRTEEESMMSNQEYQKWVESL